MIRGDVISRECLRDYPQILVDLSAGRKWLGFNGQSLQVIFTVTLHLSHSSKGLERIWIDLAQMIGWTQW